MDMDAEGQPSSEAEAIDPAESNLLESLPTATQSEPGESVVPTEPVNRPSNALVIVIVSATAASLLTLLQLAALTASDRTASQRIGSAIFVAIGLAFLVASWIAWQVGGYRRLISKDGLRLLSPKSQVFVKRAKRSTIKGIYDLGNTLSFISAIAAGVLVFMSLVVTPARVIHITAVVTLSTFAAGFVLRSLGKKSQKTLTARADSLSLTMSSLSKTTDTARLRLVGIATELQTFEADMKAQFANLERERKETYELAETLNVDPAIVANLRRQLNKQSRKATRLGLSTGLCWNHRNYCGRNSDRSIN